MADEVVRRERVMDAPMSATMQARGTPAERETTAPHTLTHAYLIPGAGGMLGTALQRVAGERFEQYQAVGQEDLDITDRVAVERAVEAFARALGPGVEGVVVNAAAYTNVEGAEDDPGTAYSVNEHGARNLARATRDGGLRFVHVSTDFVFDGTASGPYREYDEPNPLSVYGASKLAGEWAVAATCPDALTIRTAWVFGANGSNFPLKVLAAARDRGELTVVDDEIGSPTYTVDLAAGILGLLEAGAPGGVYHLAGSGATTRYGLALEVLRLAGIDAPVARAHSSDFKTKAVRPANSVLDCPRAAAYGVSMPTWRDGLIRFLEDLQVLPWQYL